MNDEKLNVVQESQKDFTRKNNFKNDKKNSYDKKAETTIDKIQEDVAKPEKVDLKFNVVSEKNTENNSTPQEINKIEEKKIEAKKVETKKVEKSKVSGKVITVSPLSYSVQTKDGSGYRIVGKHNKKVGDVV